MPYSQSVLLTPSAVFNAFCKSWETFIPALGVSSKTIKRHIKEMDNVSYIGRGFSGHWEIADDKKL